MMKALLIDLDGVIYSENQLIDGAGRAIDCLRQRSAHLLFVTNTTSRPRAAIVEKLSQMGIAVTEQEIFTPVEVAASWLNQHVKGPVSLYLPPATAAAMTAQLVQDETPDTESVAAVVLGDLGAAWSFNRLNAAFRQLIENPDAPLVALGLSRYWKAEDGWRLDVAPFAAALECATGRKAVVMGKPAPDFFLQALAYIGVDAGEAVMVGDDIQSDIGGAQAVGIKGILVRTGKFRPKDLQGDVQPDYVIDSCADLPDLWQRLSTEEGDR